MKIRSGFVSNSSSSSFVIFGKRIGSPEKAIKEGKKVFVHLNGGGTSGEAEDWGMWLNAESWEILRDSKWFKGRTPVYFLCPEGVDEDMAYSDRLVTTKDIENQELFAFDRDYSSPNNIDQLKKFLEQVGG